MGENSWINSTWLARGGNDALTGAMEQGMVSPRSSSSVRVADSSRLVDGAVKISGWTPTQQDIDETSSSSSRGVISLGTV